MLFLIALITNLLIVDNAFADKGFYEQHKNNEAIIDRPFVQINVSQMINWLKNINFDSVQTGIVNLQRVIGMVQDLTTKDFNDVKFFDAGDLEFSLGNRENCLNLIEGQEVVVWHTADF